MTSARKSYISKSVQKKENYTCWKVWKYSLVSEDSFIKNNLYMTLGLKRLLSINGKNFDFQKIPFGYVFSIAIKVLLWGCG